MQECIFQFPIRHLIELNCYEKTVSGGSIIDILIQPVFSISMRKVFSVANITINFDDITDVSIIKYVSGLVIQDRIYCEVGYDSIVLPVTEYVNQALIYNTFAIAFICVFGGIFGGILVGTIQIVQVLIDAKNERVT
ncbi:hypothetical protein SS50377_22720 [Spironucleus salmonicida]|uniref:Uncharacterized protein n=1 Tax=Spironucleus salmonicida TaxID=348837 RepID=V6LI35_9EUKA|nr:hypothetical protein SS50377_22720 [Spironucleus salmonicida]|eukprot:EST44197.1 Hypothetical protein SS50377_16003 [Spironucleus salmonicida]